MFVEKCAPAGDASISTIEYTPNALEGTLLEGTIRLMLAVITAHITLNHTPLMEQYALNGTLFFQS